MRIIGEVDTDPFLLVKQQSVSSGETEITIHSAHKL
jgi:hypothetical protein